MPLKFLKGFYTLLDKPVRNKHIIHGVPFFLFMAIGLVVIKECATVRYDFKKNKTLTSEEIEAYGIKTNTETLEEMYDKYQKIDLDNWENVRIPRPWDETSEN